MEEISERFTLEPCEARGLAEREREMVSAICEGWGALVTVSLISRSTEVAVGAGPGALDIYGLASGPCGGREINKMLLHLTIRSPTAMGPSGSSSAAPSSRRLI